MPSNSCTLEALSPHITTPISHAIHSAWSAASAAICKRADQQHQSTMLSTVLQPRTDKSQQSAKPHPLLGSEVHALHQHQSVKLRSSRQPNHRIRLSTSDSCYWHERRRRRNAERSNQTRNHVMPSPTMSTTLKVNYPSHHYTYNTQHNTTVRHRLKRACRQCTECYPSGIIMANLAALHLNHEHH